MKVKLVALYKDYNEEPWNPFWEYELNWSGEFTEVYMLASEG